ncbi:ankyrin repeat domain-containing protein [Candidatus Methylocalor cossyra]|uniref:Rhodanese-related sulfurtransferase n=1 Tax=Candidatus Methylocalor cossyra TaxID=3108543 RepID=A0ABM9NJC1_9GAMM
MVEQITAEAARRLIRERSPVILDVRDARAYSDARIPDAIHATLATINAAVRRFRRDTPLLIYCYRGHSSRDFAQLFAERGFREVYSLEGGFHAWHASGAEIQRPGPAIVRTDPAAAWLLERGGNPDDPNALLPCGTPPLVEACRAGRADLVQGLLAAGADPNCTDPGGNDALWAACRSGDVNTVALLLAAGADPNRANGAGTTSLVQAASSGKTAIVALLLQAGADPQLKAGDGPSALECAANLEVLKLLRRAHRRLNPAR